MPRLEPLPPPYSPSVTEDLTKLMPPGMEPLALFKTLAHNPRVLGRVRRGGLLDPGSIPIRARELMILRTTALCGAEYEWGVHAAFFASAAELNEEQLEATVTGRFDAFSPAERVLLEACDMLHASSRLDDATWWKLRVHWRPEQLVELVMLAGQYHGISYLINAFEIALEPGAPRFPGR